MFLHRSKNLILLNSLCQISPFTKPQIYTLYYTQDLLYVCSLFFVHNTHATPLGYGWRKFLLPLWLNIYLILLQVLLYWWNVLKKTWPFKYLIPEFNMSVNYITNHPHSVKQQVKVLPIKVLRLLEILLNIVRFGSVCKVLNVLCSQINLNVTNVILSPVS